MRPAGRVNDFLRIATVFVLAVGVCIPSSEAYGQSGPVLHPYQGADDWARLPSGRTWGAPTGVEMDPDQESLWVLERCGDYNGPGCAESDLPAIMKFDSSGRLIQSFGAGMFLYPHGLAVDHEGNVYVTDGRGEAGKGHTVLKFNPDGELVLTLGQPGVGGEGPNTLNRPSDVAIAPNGDIFVADGHSGMDTNMRIVKYSKDGTFIKEWGTKGTAPGELDGAGDDVRRRAPRNESDADVVLAHIQGAYRRVNYAGRDLVRVLQGGLDVGGRHIDRRNGRRARLPSGELEQFHSSVLTRVQVALSIECHALRHPRGTRFHDRSRDEG